MVGWSDGGITALVMAARYPELIRKMVVFGANSYVTEEEANIWQGNHFISTLFCLLQNIDHRKFSVVGWSDGGNSALIIAARYPDLIKKLVVFGSNSYVSKEDYDIFQGTWFPAVRCV